MDLARDLVRLSGRDPDTQPIDVVGLRPGEKLHEELFYDAERVEPTSVAKVLRAIASPPPADLRDQVQRLLSMATGARDDELRCALLDYAGRGELPSELADAERPALVPVPMDLGNRGEPASIVS
jgi:hypothetical protein